jgi:hypothetical protein
MDKDYGKVEISRGTSGMPKAQRGYAVWIESGHWYTAPAFTRKNYYPHDYNVRGAYDKGVRDCRCGCWMLSSSSGGPVDPFGACPEQPRAK